MRLASVNKKYYCGIDLHAHNSFICIMNKNGNILLHREIDSDFDSLYSVIKRYRASIAICCESTFNWYWLSDGCRQNGIAFYLGHALYMKAIHGGKKKDDPVDSRTLADLLRTGYFPLAYDYPQGMRATRDLLRRRQKLVNLRARFCRHIKISMYQQAINKLPDNMTQNKKERRSVLASINNPDVHLAIETDLQLIEHLDKMIPPIEHQVRTQAKQHDPKALGLLKTIDGVGDILALNLLYEIHTIRRFDSPQDFSSYSGVVKVPRSSNHKKVKGGNQKIRNPYLRWTMGEIACLSMKYYPSIKKHYQKMKARIGARKALQRLAHKFAVAIYYMLKTGSAFDVNRFTPA